MNLLQKSCIGVRLLGGVWLGALTAAPALAQTFLYWTEAGDQPGPGRPGPSYVRRSNLDGTGITTVLTLSGQNQGNFNGIESSGATLLIANQGNGGTKSYGSGYTASSFLFGSGYDVAYANEDFFTSLGSSGEIVSNLVGLSPGGFVGAIDVVGNSIYYSDPVANTLRRMNGDGSANTVLLSGSTIYDFEVTDSFIYYGDLLTNTINRANLDGSGAFTLITGATFVNGLEVTMSGIYWSEFLSGAIRRANLDGTAVTDLVTGRQGLRGVTAVTVAAVPEPATAVMWCGLGALLMAMIRRQR